MSRSINGRYTLAYPNLLGFQELTSDIIVDKLTGDTVFNDITDLETHSLGNNITIGKTNANTITVNSGSTTYNNNETITLKDNSSSSYILGSAGNTRMMVLDTTNATPNVNLSSSTNLIINNANDSSSYTDGTASLVVKGGISCAKRIVGGNITANGNLYASWDTTVVHALNVGNVINSTYTAPSTSTTTGAIICAGGVGVAGDMNVGGTVTTTHLISTGSVQGVGIASTGNIQAYGNTIYAGAIIASGAITGSIINSSSSINCSSITDTMSTTTGAIITAGGVGIAKSLNVGQSINCNALTCGSACNVGSLVSGGVISGTTITSTIGLKLPTSGGTATALNYYEEATTSIALAPSIGGAYVYNGNVYIIRIGKLVTIRIPFFTGNALGGYMIAAAASGIPVRFRPSSNAVFAIPIMMSNGTSGINQNYPGQLVIASTGEIRIYSSCGGTGTFTSGAGSGLLGDLVVSWTMY
jgi:hypothetical protein